MTGADAAATMGAAAAASAAAVSAATAESGAEALIGVSLGRQIRAARTAKKLSMRSLAAAADISQPFLSQIESGHTMPSIATLFRLAKVLGMSPSALLPSDPEPDPVRVVRAGEGDRVPLSGEADDRAGSRILAREAERGATVQEYRIAGPYLGDWIESDGQNIVYVVTGTITLMIDGRGEWELAAGDALAHPGSLRNRWAVRGAEEAVLVLVHAPA